MNRWYAVNGELRRLLTEPQLRAHLAEHGLEMRADVPVAAQWQGKPLYDAGAALRFCETIEDWWT